MNRILEEFLELDKKFKEFYELISNVNTTDDDRFQDILMRTLNESDLELFANAAQELKDIRTFYQNCFFATSSYVSQVAIVQEYEDLYKTLHKITKNEISAEIAIENIQINTMLWKFAIEINNVLYLCSALAWVVPIQIGLMLVGGGFSSFGINPLVGISTAFIGYAAIALSFYSMVSNLESLQSTAPITQDGLLELSFFNKMNSIFAPDGSTISGSIDDEDSFTI